MRNTKREKDPLSKARWSDADFAIMGWHDATLYAGKYDSEARELLLDTDYIAKWIAPLTKVREMRRPWTSRVKVVDLEPSVIEVLRSEPLCYFRFCPESVEGSSSLFGFILDLFGDFEVLGVS